MYKESIIIKNRNLLDNFQYYLSLIISILFAIGLIPFMYSKVFKIIIILIFIQTIISLVRFRFANIFLELILVILSILSLIPILGFLTRLVGIIVSILEIATFKNEVIYKKVEVKTMNSFDNFGFKQSKSNKKYSNKNSKFSNNNYKDKKIRKENIVDVDFEEK